MSWIALISTILSIVRWLIETGQKNQWIAEGEDREIAKNLAATMELTRAGKIILENLTQLSDSELDEFLRSLERQQTASDK